MTPGRHHIGCIQYSRAKLLYCKYTHHHSDLMDMLADLSRTVKLKCAQTGKSAVSYTDDARILRKDCPRCWYSIKQGIFQDVPLHLQHSPSPFPQMRTAITINANNKSQCCKEHSIRGFEAHLSAIGQASSSRGDMLNLALKTTRFLTVVHASFHTYAMVGACLWANGSAVHICACIWYKGFGRP